MGVGRCPVWVVSDPPPVMCKHVCWWHQATPMFSRVACFSIIRFSLQAVEKRKEPRMHNATCLWKARNRERPLSLRQQTAQHHPALCFSALRSAPLIFTLSRSRCIGGRSFHRASCSTTHSLCVCVWGVWGGETAPSARYTLFYLAMASVYWGSSLKLR